MSAARLGCLHRSRAWLGAAGPPQPAVGVERIRQARRWPELLFHELRTPARACLSPGAPRGIRVRQLGPAPDLTLGGRRSSSGGLLSRRALGGTSFGAVRCNGGVKGTAASSRKTSVAKAAERDGAPGGRPRQLAERPGAVQATRSLMPPTSAGPICPPCASCWWPSNSETNEARTAPRRSSRPPSTAQLPTALPREHSHASTVPLGARVAARPRRSMSRVLAARMVASRRCPADRVSGAVDTVANASSARAGDPPRARWDDALVGLSWYAVLRACPVPAQAETRQTR
jgi:hypothetical protein